MKELIDEFKEIIGDQQFLSFLDLLRIENDPDKGYQLFKKSGLDDLWYMGKGSSLRGLMNCANKALNWSNFYEWQH